MLTSQFTVWYCNRHTRSGSIVDTPKLPKVTMYKYILCDPYLATCPYIYAGATWSRTLVLMNPEIILRIVRTCFQDNILCFCWPGRDGALEREWITSEYSVSLSNSEQSRKIREFTWATRLNIHRLLESRSHQSLGFLKCWSSEAQLQSPARPTEVMLSIS